jgi:hypothetical protein
MLLLNRCTGADFNEVRIAVVGNVDAGKRYELSSSTGVCELCWTYVDFNTTVVLAFGLIRLACWHM